MSATQRFVLSAMRRDTGGRLTTIRYYERRAPVYRRLLERLSRNIRADEDRIESASSRSQESASSSCQAGLGPMVYPDSSEDERKAWDAAKCADCKSGGAWMYCNHCERDLCTRCRDKHHATAPTCPVPAHLRHLYEAPRFA